LRLLQAGAGSWFGGFGLVFVGAVGGNPRPGSSLSYIGPRPVKTAQRRNVSGVVGRANPSLEKLGGLDWTRLIASSRSPTHWIRSIHLWAVEGWPFRLMGLPGPAVGRPVRVWNKILMDGLPVLYQFKIHTSIPFTLLKLKKKRKKGLSCCAYDLQHVMCDGSSSSGS
jgi:hypothetical protein